LALALLSTVGGVTTIDQARVPEVRANPVSVSGVRSQSPVGRPAGRLVVTALRILCFEPIVALGPELISVARGKPDGISHLVTSSNDVLGTSALALFVLMLAVTPLHTVTGWKWHRVLRRDFGRAMFGYACLDLVIAAALSAQRFPGGLMSRVGGHGFLVSGTLSTFLVVPVMITSSRAAQRWLGRHWKVLHRLVYVTWATILIHLAFLFAFRSFFIDMLIVSTPLAIVRIGGVERWWISSRRSRSHTASRAVAGVALLAIFVAGIEPFFVELAHVSASAFSQRPH
jgi:sulfoxide reductase heme-binding subunit YedZ